MIFRPTAGPLFLSKLSFWRNFSNWARATEITRWLSWHCDFWEKQTCVWVAPIASLTRRSGTGRIRCSWIKGTTLLSWTEHCPQTSSSKTPPWKRLGCGRSGCEVFWTGVAGFDPCKCQTWRYSGTLSRGKTCKCGALPAAPHSCYLFAKRTRLIRSWCLSSRSMGFDLQTGILSISAQFLGFAPLKAQLLCSLWRTWNSQGCKKKRARGVFWRSTRNAPA